MSLREKEFNFQQEPNPRNIFLFQGLSYTLQNQRYENSKLSVAKSSIESAIIIVVTQVEVLCHVSVKL